MEKKDIRNTIQKQVIPAVLTSLMLCTLTPAGFAKGNDTSAVPETTISETETVTASQSLESQEILQAAAESTVKIPEANIKPGMYRSAQKVTLTAEEGAKIYYTTNNLMPDETDTEYTVPIEVTSDTNICAIAVKNGKKSAATTFGYFIRTSETPVMQFMVMSDVEIGEGLETAGGGEKVYEIDKPRINKAMEVTKSLFDSPNLLVMNGDIVKCNSGKPDKSPDHATFIKLMQDSMAENGLSNTQVQVTMGNHDALGHNVSAMKKYYTGDAESWFPADTGYYHNEVDGLDFIYLNSNSAASDQQAFLTTKLAEIKKNKGESAPVFIFMHIPISGTLDDTRYSYTETWITNVLKDYPQAIVFSGHTHKTITEDRSIGQNAGFTAVNEGTMTYAESTDSGILSYGADGSVQDIYQFPVAQCAAVEVYDDRIEINRVTINGDTGNAKANGYVPQEPFNNCGFSAGDRWVIQRGNTDAEWKEGFQYKPEQRKAAAVTPKFAEGAKPVLSGKGRTATVTLPQAEDAQKVHYYLIEMVDSSGKAAKSIKVRSENVFSPMPKTLTYSIDGLSPETTVRARVTAYNEYGAASVPILSETAYPVPAIPGIKPVMLTNESLDQAETDETQHTIPYIDAWKNNSTQIEGKAEVKYENGAAVLSSLGDGDTFEMWIPFQPKVKKEDESLDFQILPGEFFLEYEYQMLDGMKEGVSWFRSKEGNVMKVLFSSDGKTITVQTSGATKSAWNTYATGSADFKTKPVKLKYLLGTANGKQYIKGFWVNGMLVESKRQDVNFNGSADGWKQMNFALPSTASSYTTGAGTQYCKVDNFKVWTPTAAQIQELLNKEEDTVSFDQIKGDNSEALSVTQNLNLAALIGTQTKNGLVITGWKSDNEMIIQPDGTVTRPAFAGDTATVALTPLLGMVDLMGETDQDYVSIPGTAIQVTVPDLGQDPLEVATTGYIANEDFSSTHTEPTSDTTILPFASNYVSGVLGTSTITFTDGDTGEAKWSSASEKGGQEFGIPFQPGAVLGTNPDKGNQTTCAAQPLDGEFTFEFDLTFLEDLPGGLWIYLRNGDGKNAARLDLSKSAVSYRYYNANNTLTALVNNKGITSSATHKVRLTLGTEGSTPYLNGLWIDGSAITTAKQKIEHANYQSDKGWTLLQVTSDTTLKSGGDFCTIDNIKCWRSAEDQAKELAAADEGKITFDQIKGSNSGPENVTGDLTLKSGELGALQTANKLLVMGWKSSKPEVISTTGAVTPAGTDTAVSLTPVLAIKDAENGGYVAVDGTPITVTVKAVGSKFRYLANETFDQEETDATQHAIPYIESWKNGLGSVVYENGTAKFMGGDTTWNCDMRIPFQPQIKGEGNSLTFDPVSGEFYLEYEYQILDGMQDGISYLQSAGGNVMQVLFSENGKTITLKTSGTTASNWSDYTATSADFKNAPVKLRYLLGTADGKQYIRGFWVNGQQITNKQQEVNFNASANGWSKIQFGRNNKATYAAGTKYCAVDNFKAWRPAAAQLAELAGQSGGSVTFDQIKGGNSDPTDIKTALALGSAGTTPNGLKVLSWKSSAEDIIDPLTGTVTDKFLTADKTVVLTPVLGLIDAEHEGDGEMVETDGASITVTVKGKGLGFTDAAMKQVTVLNPAITQGIADISGLSGQVVAIAALYQGDRLEKAWTGETVTAGTEGSVASVSIDGLPDDLTGMTLKLFVWEADTQRPLYLPAEVSTTE